MPLDLVEYLYTDKKRLKSYYEQITSTPVIYDKVPVWKAVLGLTGPTAEGQQTRPPRPATEKEEIAALLRYLENSSTRRAHRASASEPLHTFRLASIGATRVWIPPRTQDTLSFPGLRVWVHARPNAEGGQDVLYLLEDYLGDDEPENSFPSAFSLLLVLQEFQRREFEQSILLGGRPLDQALQREIDAGSDADPTQWLRDLGCVVEATRAIRTLYRVRSVALAFPLPGQPVRRVTFGYPIFIAVAESIGESTEFLLAE